MKKTTLIIAIIFAMGIVAPAFADNERSNLSAIANRSQLIKEAKEKYENVNAQYAETKQNYLGAMEKYKSSKSNWESAKKAFLENRNITNITASMVEKGKAYLTSTVDTRIKHIELVKSKAENMSVLSDAEKSSIITELDANIAALSALKPEISAVTTKEGLKAIAAKIKTEWINSRQGIERAAGIMLSAREAQLTTLAEKTSSALKTRIEKAKTSGKDMSAYDEVISEFDAKIASAKSDIDAARAKFGAAENASASNEKQTLLKEGNHLLKSANEKIKEAHKLLKDAVKNAASKIKDARKAQKENKTASIASVSVPPLPLA